MYIDEQRLAFVGPIAFLTPSISSMLGINRGSLYLDHAIIVTSGEEMWRRVHNTIDRCTGRKLTDVPWMYIAIDLLVYTLACFRQGSCACVNDTLSPNCIDGEIDYIACLMALDSTTHCRDLFFPTA